MGARPKTCERAAEFVSLDLDGELSRFERVLLARHLRRCAGCADYSAQVTAATKALRSAPLEALPAPVALPSFRRRMVPRVVWNVAATAAIAAFGIWFAVAPSPDVRARTGGGVDIGAGLSSDVSDWPGGVLPKRTPVTPFLPGSRRGLRGLVS